MNKTPLTRLRPLEFLQAKTGQFPNCVGCRLCKVWLLCVSKCDSIASNYGSLRLTGFLSMS